MKNKKSSVILTFILTFILTNLTTILTVFVYLVIKFIVITYYDIPSSTMDSVQVLVLVFGIINLVSSMFYLTFILKYLMIPLSEINSSLDKIKEGDYTVKLKVKNTFFLTKNIVNTFNDMAKKLNSVDTMKNDFIASMSHELKTPLSAIEGYSKLIDNENITKEESNQYIEIIRKNAEHLSKLAEDILIITKFEGEQIISENELYSLDEQIRQSIIFMEPKWQSKNIEFDLELQPIKIVANPSILQHVWFNLISNAIKFSKENSIISINSFNNGRDVKVIVSDNGCGISEEQQKHIFEKFYQADSSRGIAGNGLGLAIVKNVLDVYKSEITVNSTLGEGSTFTVTLKNILPK